MIDTNTFLEMLKLTWEVQARARPGSGEGFISMFTDAPEIVGEVWDLLQGLYGNFIGLFSDLSQIIHILDFLPTPWVTIMLTILGIVIVLRIYAFFADIEIGGFKI